MATVLMEMQIFTHMEVVMPERSADSKESVNLHDDTIGEGEEPKEVVNTKACCRISTDVCFLDNNGYDAITEKKRDPKEVIDLKDMDWHNLVPVVTVSLVGQHDVDEDAEEHHGYCHPGHDQAYLHVIDIYVAG